MKHNFIILDEAVEYSVFIGFIGFKVDKKQSLENCFFKKVSFYMNL
jgi:hypothetical protein